MYCMFSVYVITRRLCGSSNHWWERSSLRLLKVFSKDFACKERAKSFKPILQFSACENEVEGYYRKSVVYRQLMSPHIVSFESNKWEFCNVDETHCLNQNLMCCNSKLTSNYLCLQAMEVQIEIHSLRRA